MSKYIDLTQPLWEYSPKWVFEPEVEFFQIQQLVRDGVLTRGIRTSLHAGTHIDAPAHFGYPMSLDEIPLETLCGTGVVLDVRRDAWGAITAEDLENMSPRINQGDRVVLNTGWHRFFDTDPQTFVLKYPGLDKSAADWLVEKKVSWVGSDTPSPDHPFCLSTTIHARRPDVLTPEIFSSIDRSRFPLRYTHKTLLSNNIPIIEQIGGAIDEVTGRRVTLIALPLKLKRSEASQIRLIAVV
ncbi:MAG: cyclase family protein [Pseudomonadota bacterium]